MIRVDRRLLAWIVSLGVGCLGATIAVWLYRPFVFSSSGSGGLGAVSFGFPSLSAWPLVIGNLVLSVIARRRGGRAASIGSFCLWTIGILVVITLSVSLTPPGVLQSADPVSVIALFILLAMSATLPVQLLLLAVLTFALIASPRPQRAAGD